MDISFPHQCGGSARPWGGVPEQGHSLGPGAVLFLLVPVGIAEAVTRQGESSLHGNTACELCSDPQDLHREAPDHHSLQQHLLEAWDGGAGADSAGEQEVQRRGAGRGAVVCVSCPCPVLV